jgi:hypothetical protein
MLVDPNVTQRTQSFVGRLLRGDRWSDSGLAVIVDGEFVQPRAARDAFARQRRTASYRHGY